MVAFFLAGSNSLISHERLMTLFKVSSYIIMVVYSVFIGFAYKTYLSSGLLGLENFDLSLNVAPVLIPFVYFLAKKQYTAVIIPTVLILLSGKRALIVTLFAILLLFVLFKKVKIKLKFTRVLNVVVVIIIVVIIALMVVMYEGDSSHLIDSAAKRISTLNIFQQHDVNFDTISSGRINEIIKVLEISISSPLYFLFGSGYGNFIPIDYESTLDHKIYHLEKIGFDVLPIHFVYLYGIVPAIIFCGSIAIVLQKKYSRLKKMALIADQESYEILTILFFIVTSIFIASLFTYINPDPLLWFLLGLLCSKDMWKYARHAV
jgi:hypothetical protein